MFSRTIIIVPLSVITLIAPIGCGDGGGGGGGGGISPLTPTFQCEDGMDNDGDGVVDFPDDPGCETPSDDAEVDPDIEPSLTFIMTERSCGSFVGPIVSNDAGGVEFFFEYTVGVLAQVRVFHITTDNERVAGVTGAGDLRPAANRRVSIQVGSNVAMETKTTIFELRTLDGELLTLIEVPCGFIYV